MFVSVADIDECATETYDCPKHSSCVNTEGSYDCECDEGYMSHQDKCVGKCVYGIHGRMWGGFVLRENGLKFANSLSISQNALSMK